MVKQCDRYKIQQHTFHNVPAILQRQYYYSGLAVQGAPCVLALFLSFDFLHYVII